MLSSLPYTGNLVILTDDEVFAAKSLADSRGAGKEAYASTNRWTADAGAYHYHGILGEMAYAKQYNVEIDLSVSVDGDGGFDLTILGMTVDVKTSNYNPPILKLNSIRDFESDLMALALRHDDRHIELCGFTDAKNLLKKFYTRDFGNGARVCLDAEHLFF